MIGTGIAIILLVVLILMSFNSWQKAIILYIVFSMISPHINLSGNQLSFEIIAFFPVMFILFLKNKRVFSLYTRWKYRQMLWLYILLLFISSLLAMVSYDINFPLISLFGHLRIVCMIYMLQALYEEDADFQIDIIIAPVLFINFIISIIQLLIPNTVQLFYDFYFKASLTPLNEVLRLGYFNRAYGTFGTPVILGVFALFSFALYLGFYVEKKDIKMLRVKILLSGLIGVLALSKTVIIGIPAILIVTYLLIIMEITRVKNKKIYILPLIIAATGHLVIQILIKLNTSILYYVRFLNEPLNALTSRYNANTGILAETYQIIGENLFIGVGPNQLNGAFLGDSMYIVILYTIGILGLLIYFGIITPAIARVILSRKTISILCGVTLLLTGLAAPVHLNNISAPFLAYLFSSAGIRKTTKVNEAYE